MGNFSALEQKNPVNSNLKINNLNLNFFFMKNSPKVNRRLSRLFLQVIGERLVDERFRFLSTPIICDHVI